MKEIYDVIILQYLTFFVLFESFNKEKETKIN